VKTPIVVLPGLLPLDLAERVYDFLSGPLPAWLPYEARHDWITCVFERAYDHAIPDCFCELCEAIALLRSERFCADLAGAVGVSGLVPASLFATRYRSDHECSSHTDEGNGDVAFVWNLSKRWRIEFGGNLVFDQVTLVPTFNQVVAFDVSGKGRGHAVTPVTVGKPSRLAISGWYKAVQG
jgi:hypothetical protein